VTAQPGAATQPAKTEAPKPPTPESPGAPVPTPQSQAQPEKKTEVALATPPPDKVEAKAAPVKPQAAGAGGKPTITGKINFKGQPPETPEIDMKGVPDCHRLHANPVFEESVVVNENQTLKNVVVYISAGLPAGDPPPPPAEPAVLNQVGCVYEPHVLAVQTGQKIVVKNSDAFLHNVHSLANVNPAFNFGQPNIDPGKHVEPMKAAEVFRVKCDVHPWMNAHVAVFEHPYFSVTGDDGSFSITNLPPGNYTLTAWHETLGEQKQEVTVEEGKPASVELTFGS
jgi:plastocyanin